MRERMLVKLDNNLQLDDPINEKDEKFLHKLDLPHDLITQYIITRLPIKSLLQCKSISKQWYSTLSSPYFGNTHFNFSPFYQSFNPIIHNLLIQSGNDYFIYTYNECDFVDECNKGLFKLDVNFDDLPKDKILVIGSCNGLLCLYCSLGYLIIWNPIINQWVKFSCPSLENCKNSTWGFGYVSCVDDYKAVRMSESKGNPSEILVHVFSLRNEEWKQVYDEKICKYVLRGASLSAGLLIDETLYWIVYRQGGEYEQDVLGFDLGFERFDIVQNLVQGDSYIGWVRFLCCMGGCLSMSRVTDRGDVSVSMLKQSGQVDYIGVYRDLDLGSCCSAVGFTRDGKFFVQVGQRELGLVNPNCSPKRYTPLFKFKGEGFIDMKSYVPSLVSPSAVSGMQE
ncbi:putative F-box/LRR-repeat/kelch-repeat protein At1g11620 [Silene latifolia]|uniref:putative F-box/LRR-repeat/kelch-repeat protein At1g11620 n=1 Tax=Silene latifolia TaxID=37657 RepID=UPI003D781D60